MGFSFSSFAQCVLTPSDDTEIEVLICLSSCFCNEVIIPDGVTINMDGPWDLALGAITFRIQGSGSLVFSGSGMGADELILASGSLLIIEDVNNTNALTTSGGGGNVRVTIGTEKFQGNDFTEIIEAGGADENGVLPIDLIFFSATSIIEQVYLSWATASEENFDYFEIQRAVGSDEFESIGALSGAGENVYSLQDYEFYDEYPLDGINYYRLKATDLDGTFEYSDIQAVKMEVSGEVSVFPNSIQNQQLQLVSTYTNPQQYLFYDTKGTLIHTGEISTGSQFVRLPELQPGLYILKVSGIGVAQTVKVMFE